MNDVPATIGGRIRQERERLELTEKEMAERMGIHRNRLRALEDGTAKRGPGFEELGALGLQGADVNYILTGQGTLNPEERALVENYRASTDADRKSLRSVGNAFAKSRLMDGDAKVGGD